MAGLSLSVSNLLAILFSFTVPLMLDKPAYWNVKTGFL